MVRLHAFSHATGYSRYTQPAVASLVQRGFAVLAFDQPGFETRPEYAGRFYQRYPGSIPPSGAGRPGVRG